MLAGLFAGMFVELTALFAIPFFLYRGLGLTGGSFWELVLVQCLVLVLSRIIMLPGNAGGAEGSFYLFMGPLFGRHLAVGWCCGALPPFWRFCCWAEPGRAPLCAALGGRTRDIGGERLGWKIYPP